MSVISPGPIKIPGGPNWPGLVTLAKDFIEWMKRKLGSKKPVNKNSSLEDINELNQIFAEYRNSVEKQSGEIEAALCEDLKSYAEDLAFIAQTDHPVFQKYHVHFQRFRRKVDTLPKRMEGVIMDKVSRVVSLDAPECNRVIRMLPGTEKDRAAEELLRSALRQGLQSAVEKAEELSNELIEEYEDAVSEAVEQVAITSDAIAKEADQLAANSGSGDAELTLARTESVKQALVLVELLLKEEV